MEKIFEDAGELNIRKFVVYGKTVDKKLYYESDFKTQVTKADAENAFKKGMLLIMDTTTMLAPISMAGTTVKTVTETTGSNASTSLVSWAVKE